MPLVNEGELEMLSPPPPPDYPRPKEANVSKRQNLKRIASRFPTEANWSHYRYIKNNVNYEIKNAKISY